ncbi:hypothetical protein AWQ23_10440 [Picosynechococcus sp. PCC 73109]|nr:hypothetical protein AWQ23_10440 [Picosynechococcus sp. PCC 73109]
MSVEIKTPNRLLRLFLRFLPTGGRSKLDVPRAVNIPKFDNLFPKDYQGFQKIPQFNKHIMLPLETVTKLSFWGDRQR